MCGGSMRERMRRWFTDKPGSVPRRLFTGAATVIYLGPQLLAASSDLPESR